jgi:hypothetical protein
VATLSLSSGSASVEKSHAMAVSFRRRASATLLTVTVLDLVTVVVLAWFGSRLVLSFRRALAGPARAHSMALVRGLRPRHFLPVPLVLALVLMAALTLVQLPVLSFGWWTAIGGQGNPVFGLTDRTEGTPFELVVPAAFVTLVLPALPLLVEREEQLFRSGAEQWSPARRVQRAVGFGLVHALIGIPIGVALALSIGGGWFTLAYLRTHRRTGFPSAALRESTRCHLAYDLTVIAIVVVWLAAYARSL